LGGVGLCDQLLSDHHALGSKPSSETAVKCGEFQTPEFSCGPEPLLGLWNPFSMYCITSITILDSRLERRFGILFDPHPGIPLPTESLGLTSPSHASPAGALARACNYTLTLWENLTRFLEYPEPELSNNLGDPQCLRLGPHPCAKAHRRAIVRTSAERNNTIPQFSTFKIKPLIGAQKTHACAAASFVKPYFFAVGGSSPFSRRYMAAAL
jgi:hypothetical protein